MKDKLLIEAKKELSKNSLTLKMLGIRLPFDNIERFFSYMDKKNKKERPDVKLNPFKL